ncbi:MAG: hypothetical protein GEU97_04135 [Actinophytocola sp.]|nr:hypothetical protein [Actinophytocola sp.]
MTDSATNEPAHAAKRRGWAGLALIVLALLAIGNLGNLSGDDAADSGATPTADTARTTCQDYVIDRGHVPATAEFGLSAVTSTGRSTWTVTGSAAMTNDAGARVRVAYECTVHGDASGRWSLVELTHARR